MNPDPVPTPPAQEPESVGPPTTEAAPTPSSAPAPEATPNAAPQAVPGTQATSEDPGKILGVISIVLPFVGLALVGLIVGIVGLKKSKAKGHKNTPALIGIILSAIGTVIGIIFAIVFAAAITSTVQKCQELGPGVHYEGNTTYTCS